MQYDGVQPLADANGAESFILNVPYRSQYDGSAYQNSNCGPAALGMVLQAYGIQATNQQIRDVANQLQGTSDTDTGIALDYLQAIAEQVGLRTEGLTSPDGRYHTWSMADLIREIRRGYPVITLVHYATLPEHSGSPSTSDHYIVVIGVTSQGFVVNDPAFTGNGGFRQLLRPDQLIAAWRDASIPEQAVAFLPPIGTPSLALLNRVGNTVPLAPLARQSIRSTPAPAVNPSSLSAVPPATRSGDDGSTTSVVTAANALNPPVTARLGQWQHSTASVNARPSPSSSPTEEAPPVVAATVKEPRSESSVPLTGLVIIAVVAGAVAILRLPGQHSQ